MTSDELRELARTIYFRPDEREALRRANQDIAANPDLRDQAEQLYIAHRANVRREMGMAPL